MTNSLRLLICIAITLFGNTKALSQTDSPTTPPKVTQPLALHFRDMGMFFGSGTLEWAIARQTHFRKPSKWNHGSRDGTLVTISIWPYRAAMPPVGVLATLVNQVSSQDEETGTINASWIRGGEVTATRVLTTSARW